MYALRFLCKNITGFFKTMAHLKHKLCKFVFIFLFMLVHIMIILISFNSIYKYGTYVLCLKIDFFIIYGFFIVPTLKLSVIFIANFSLIYVFPNLQFQKVHLHNSLIYFRLIISLSLNVPILSQSILYFFPLILLYTCYSWTSILIPYLN